MSKCPFNAVLAHARFFAGKDDALTTESMTAGHTIQKITAGVPLKCRAILNMLQDRKMEVTAEALATLVNPAATGLWTSEGYFDEKRFTLLAAKAITDQGKAIITKALFRELCPQREKLGKATHIFWKIPVSWKAVTKGSINELFEYYSDHWYKNPKGKYEKALTVEQIRAFYTDPVSVMQRRQKGEFQLPKPKA